MTVNATLIIQMIHFFVAYLLFDRLLLRRAMVMIMQKEERALLQQNQLRDAAIQKEALIAIKHEQQVAHKKRFSSLCPALIEAPAYEPITAQKIEWIFDQKSIVQLQADSLQALIKSCSVVRS